jgi:hypothetical protein
VFAGSPDQGAEFVCPAGRIVSRVRIRHFFFLYSIRLEIRCSSSVRTNPLRHFHVWSRYYPTHIAGYLPRNTPITSGFTHRQNLSRNAMPKHEVIFLADQIEPVLPKFKQSFTLAHNGVSASPQCGVGPAVLAPYLVRFRKAHTTAQNVRDRYGEVGSAGVSNCARIYNLDCSS